jgi:hypothetical protein
MYAEDDEDLVERVSDDEPQDDDAMVEDDGNGDNRGSGQQARSRTGRDVPDDEPALEGYERFVSRFVYSSNHTSTILTKFWIDAMLLCWCC